uniref:Uncharacterized protein n=1 Tax=Anguilla anguilla TaxID=7936 RepID=A0A0E9UH30_ANGAN
MTLANFLEQPSDDNGTEGSTEKNCVPY